MFRWLRPWVSLILQRLKQFFIYCIQLCIELALSPLCYKFSISKLKYSLMEHNEKKAGYHSILLICLQFQAHLLRTHIVMEPIAIGMFRCLSRSHPIYKLLRPHLQTVVAINTMGRIFLIGENAAANFTLSMSTYVQV